MIKAGCSVLHRPTGETWFVLGVNAKEDRLCPAGYPPAIAKISDCKFIEFIHELTEEEKAHRDNHHIYSMIKWDE